VFDFRENKVPHVAARAKSASRQHKLQQLHLQLQQQQQQHHQQLPPVAVNYRSIYSPLACDKPPNVLNERPSVQVILSCRQTNICSIRVGRDHQRQVVRQGPEQQSPYLQQQRQVEQGVPALHTPRSAPKNFQQNRHPE